MLEEKWINGDDDDSNDDNDNDSDDRLVLGLLLALKSDNKL